MPGATPYDQFGYPGHVRAQAHPRRLEALARIHGLDAAAIDTCRILEIGCGDGSHLLWLAEEFPDAHCVGIDLSERGLRVGRDMANALNLSNVEFRQADILSVNESLGEFDYIVAHGVYSWVPHAVRDKLLAICRANLAANGVAYVSYNAMPGGHFRRCADEMLVYHTRRIVEPAARIAAARDFLTTLTRWTPSDSLHGAALRSVADRIAQLGDAPVFHDHLSEYNDPCYFSEFIDHATGHGLQYLCEAQFSDSQLGNLASSVIEDIEQFAVDRLEREQYMDFVRNRSFRQTLLCRAERSVKDPFIDTDVARMYFAANLQWPADAVGKMANLSPVEFRNPGGVCATLDDPLLKRALVALSNAWPQAISLAQWSSAIDNDNHAGADDRSRLLGDFAKRGYALGLLDIQATPVRVAASVTERPQTNRLIRIQAKRSRTVSSIVGQTIEIEDDVSRLLLQLLDGCRDHNDIVSALVAGIRDQDLRLPSALANREDLDEALRSQLNGILERFARLALLRG